jgi:hypothetical protein
VPALLGPGRLGCGDGMAGRRGTLYPVRTVSWGGNGIARSEAGQLGHPAMWSPCLPRPSVGYACNPGRVDGVHTTGVLPPLRI